MKKLICIFTTMALLLIGCSGSRSKNTFASLSDFEGTKIAALSGSAFPDLVNPVIPNVEFKYFNSNTDSVSALSSGKVDAIILDMPVAKYLIAQNTDFSIFPDVVASASYGFAVTKGSALGEKANDILQKLIADGIISEMEKVWFSEDESIKTLPILDYKEDFDGSAGTLKYGCDNTNVPMSYLGSDGKPIGFDLDIMSRIAYELNMEIEFVPMNFDALLAALASGKTDVVGGSMLMTEERKQTVDFIGSYYEGGAVLVIKKD